MNPNINLDNLVGKTIVSAHKMKKARFTDTGWIRLCFSDGTSCVIEGGYEDSYDVSSESGEYASTIDVFEFDSEKFKDFVSIQ